LNTALSGLIAHSPRPTGANVEPPRQLGTDGARQVLTGVSMGRVLNDAHTEKRIY